MAKYCTTNGQLDLRRTAMTLRHADPRAEKVRELRKHCGYSRPIRHGHKPYVRRTNIRFTTYLEDENV